MRGEQGAGGAGRSRAAILRLLKAASRLPAGFRSTYVGDGRVLATTRYGQVMYLAANDLSLTPSIVLLRRWEPSVTALFRRIVQPGMHVVEVGANVGWFTVQAADLVGPTGHVTAFEPTPQTFDLLHRNVSVNALLTRCDLRAAAAGDHDGTVKIFQMGDYLGSPQIGDFRDAELDWFHQDRRVFEADLVTLDSALAEPWRRIDVLKMDAQGAEPAVLAGATDVLADRGPMHAIVEYVPVTHGPELLETFRSLGFTIEGIGRFGRTRRVEDTELAGVECVDLHLWR